MTYQANEDLSAAPVNSGTAAKDLEGVPNDRVLVLPLRVGKWKDKQRYHDNHVVDICRGCGGPIRLSHHFAAFYQGDIRFSMPNKLCLALITHDTIKGRRDRRDGDPERCKENCY